ncbi:co-chaperone GroES [Simiduia aestuariiviva]|uniref:Co-chaperonin GroES n=1 Tax=Simiduia aestuariiviva TaxID=1510459 RepID=A0A839UMK8_9GAMM|nr:co-chaperone GroES [Simiduia aestuariiviva]MBB3167779.1 chaperonin GroES [Simiduia aestuariiviva]
MQFKPLYDRVLVKRLAAETKTKGGIVIPEKSAEKPTQGEVVAVGQGAILDNGDLRALAVNRGDRVLFGQYAGTEIKVGGEEHVVLRESDILAIVEEQTQQQEQAA